MMQVSLNPRDIGGSKGTAYLVIRTFLYKRRRRKMCQLLAGRHIGRAWSSPDHKFRFRNTVQIHFSAILLSHYNTCPWFRTIYHSIINKDPTIFPT